MYTDELVNTIYRLRDDAENIAYKADDEEDKDKQDKLYRLVDSIREHADTLDELVNNFVGE